MIVFRAIIATRWGRSVALVAALALLAWGALLIAERRAVVEERERVADQNEEATNVANETELSLRDCIDAGRMWIFEAGECGRVRNGPR